MITRPMRRACVRASLVFLSTLPLAATAGTLAAFSFDAGGQFTAQPEVLGQGVADAGWHDDLNRLGSASGNPGSALVASGFTTVNGNVLHLALAGAPRHLLELHALHFDIRVSATGPSHWQWLVDGTSLGEGAATTAFHHFDLTFAASPRASLGLDLAGTGAGSASGTLRLDNVLVEGSVRPVPIPGSWFLLLTPTLGAVLQRWRRRYWPESSASCPGNAHSRQPSSSGKYRPSLIGRESSMAMARP